MFTWHKVQITLSETEENKPFETTVAGKRIGILKRGDSIYAFAALCPHASAPMCDGWVDSVGRLVCPLHKYRFDPKNGRNTSGEGYKLFTYPTELRTDGIYVGLLQ